MTERDESKKPNGLSLKDHTYLNDLDSLPPEEKRKIYVELRAKYKGNEFALQEIDVYDGDSLYNAQRKKYLYAKYSGNTQAVAELVRWFEENYPGF